MRQGRNYRRHDLYVKKALYLFILLLVDYREILIKSVNENQI